MFPLGLSAKCIYPPKTTIAEIANAMAVSKRTVFRYLSQKI